MSLRSLTRAGAMLALSALVGTVGAQVQDGSFEQNVVPGSNQYQYAGYLPGPPTTPGPAFASPWTFSWGAGLITGTGSAFNTPSPFPGGNQVAFIQGNESYVEQMLSALAPGRYTLTYWTAGRSNGGCCDGNTSYAVSFAGNMLVGGTTTSFDSWQLHSVTFVASGAGVLRFENTSGAGDHTFFLDEVALASTVPEPGTIALVASGLVGLVAFRRRRTV